MQIYVPGPCRTWIGQGGGTYLLLGTAKGGVFVEPQPHYLPVMNDAAGLSVPIDELYEGSDGFISGKWNRFNMFTYSFLSTFGSDVQGTDAVGDRGTLMLQEGFAFDVIVQFPFAAKASMQNAASGPMQQGYWFKKCYVKGNSLPALGMKDEEVDIRFYSLALPVFSSQRAGGGLGFTLYTTTLPTLLATD